MDYLKKPGNHLIQLNDICVIYISENQRYIFKAELNAQLQTKFGQIKTEDILGHQYGVRFECKKGWILPLRLTCELWTQMLPHRTQILYQADISIILLYLDIKPGSIIIESGTGSGSLSHAFIRACRPHGFLYTFEVNESRKIDAEKDFSDHGFARNVNVILKNVCESGFGDDLIGKADACMLDLPRTWDAIEHAYKALKSCGSKLCTFSPCIEQVKQNVSMMTALKMKDIVTIETLLRPYEVKVQNLRLWKEDVLDELIQVDKRRFENLKESLDTAELNDEGSTSKGALDQSTTESLVKSDQSDLDNDAILLRKALDDPKAPFHSHMLPKKAYTYPKHYNESVNHSGYLTFATKRP